MFQKVIEQNGSGKELHLFDSFYIPFAFKGNVEDELKENFRRAGLKQPIIHKGDFKETLPGELPNEIAFLHIDCGLEVINLLIATLCSIVSKASIPGWPRMRFVC